MEESVRMRKAFDYIEGPTVDTIITSFFLFGCCFGLNKHNTGWLHLREATALAQILGMQDENTYLFDDVVETSRKRRLFWLLFVTERQVSAPIVEPKSWFLMCILRYDPLLTRLCLQGVCITKAPTIDASRNHWSTNR